VKIFFASALHLDDPERRLAAFVVARDRNEAVMALRRHQAFADYAMPPEELSEYGAEHEALPRLAGARSIIRVLAEDGVYPIRDLALLED
jgi:hypothetical protein